MVADMRRHTLLALSHTRSPETASMSLLRPDPPPTCPPLRAFADPDRRFSDLPGGRESSPPYSSSRLVVLEQREPRRRRTHDSVHQYQHVAFRITETQYLSETCRY